MNFFSSTLINLVLSIDLKKDLLVKEWINFNLSEYNLYEGFFKKQNFFNGKSHILYDVKLQANIFPFKANLSLNIVDTNPVTTLLS